MAARKYVSVIAIGANDETGTRKSIVAYLMSAGSPIRLETAAKKYARILDERAAQLGIYITHGKVVRMSYEDLRIQIPGFTQYVEPCLEHKDIASAMPRDGNWQYNCYPTNGRRGRVGAGAQI